MFDGDNAPQRATGLAEEANGLRSRIATLERELEGMRAPLPLPVQLPPVQLPPVNTSPLTGPGPCQTGAAALFAKRYKLQPPEKWADPVPVTAEARKAVDWIESFLRFFSLTTGSLQGAADALWFALKDPSAQAWLTAQFRSTPAHVLDAADAAPLRALFL